MNLVERRKLCGCVFLMQKFRVPNISYTLKVSEFKILCDFCALSFCNIINHILVVLFENASTTGFKNQVIKAHKSNFLNQSFTADSLQRLNTNVISRFQINLQFTFKNVKIIERIRKH